MIWLTWRQHRGEAYVIGGVLAALAIFLIVSGRAMATTYDQLGVGRCLGSTVGSNCSDILDAFRQQWGFLLSAMQWLNFIPALIGILVGAPLVARELEHGTHRMVWTQSVPRLRWLAVKLLGVFTGTLLASVILTALLTWWLGPFDTLGGRFNPGSFDFEGAVPLAYMAFALALAICAGTIIKRSIPAMAVTLAGFLALRLPVEFALRPNYRPPISAFTDPLVTGPAVSRQDWVLDSGFADAQHHTIAFRQILDVCMPSGGPPDGTTKLSIFQCAHAHGFMYYVLYQPADRFWLFQGIESAIFGIAAAALLGVTFWWVRSRLS